MLDVPAELSDTGKQHRPYFKTIEEARLKASELRARKHNLAIASEDFSEFLKRDALQAIDLIHAVDRNATLLQAAQLFAETHRAKAHIPFVQLFDLYLEKSRGRKPKYLRELGLTKKRLAAFHALTVCDIRTEELEAFLSKLRPGAHNAQLRYLRAIFAYGIKRKYLASDPTGPLDFIIRPRKEVEILSPESFRAMLECAFEHDLELVPYLVICGFAGVRPDDEGEACKIDWADYTWAEGKLEIRAEITKNNGRRYVQLEPNAREWLEAYRLRGGVTTGLMAPFTEKVLRGKRERNRRAAKVRHWPNSAMRHSFASYWATLHHDIDTLLFMLGHSSLDMLRKNYRRAVPMEAAKKYFSIRPPAPTGNVVAFSPAA